MTAISADIFGKRKNVFLIGLSMAIGWGIRGNFGHQYGAAFAGCLATITMCLLSGRDDWKTKLLWFSFFGAIGWGFGATVSYMQVISYTESGQAATQYYGYVCLFVIGFLWAALGVAAAAWVATADAAVLIRLFKVVLYVFAVWLILDVIEDPLANALRSSAGFDDTGARQRNPLYWLDANYLPPFFALLAACVYDLVNRKEKNAIWLPLFLIGGAAAGWLVQRTLIMIGAEQNVGSALTFQLGDPTYINSTTGQPAYTAADLLTNWPQWCSDHPHAIGWVIGTIAGAAAYFKRFGRFRDGASLIVYMAGGWMIVFLLLPVLGSLLLKPIGGFRMTPPRSDDWAGIAGTLAGALIWFKRNGYMPVVVAAIVGGTLGGLGFSGAAWLKQLLMAPGSPRRSMNNTSYQEITDAWQGWQHQNWHSFLEQSYGFVNGVSIAVAMGLLARRLPLNHDRIDLPFRKWAMAFCAIFTVLVIPYVNIGKNVDTWSETLKPEVWKDATTHAAAQWDVPYLGRLPGLRFLHAIPETWFNITWLLLLLMLIAVIRAHYKKPLPLIPGSWTGRAQLLLMILLWTMVWGNFDRNITQWSSERLLTEWVITVDAIVLTYFMLTMPLAADRVIAGSSQSFAPLQRRAWRWAVIAIIMAPPLFTVSIRAVYRYSPNEVLDDHKYHLRFGPEADWRAHPVLKTQEHK